jgi:hypothetical protein
MPDNVDEDLIEATIRRVAEAKAAREGAPEPEDTDGSAEREGEPLVNSLPDPDHASPAAADTAHDDPTAGADPEPDISPTAAADGDAPHGPDEDAIAATIARVQAQKAAADAAARAPEAVPGGPDEDAIAATIRRVQAQKAAQELRYDDEEDYPAPTAVPQSRRDEDVPLPVAAAATEYADDIETFEPVSEVSASDDAIARLERGLRDALHVIAGLTSRVDALEQASSSAPRRPQIAALTGTDNDAGPRPMPSLDAPPRPTIVRDAFPPERAALAEKLPVPDAIDTRPLPEPLPPIHVESRRGLDLLPRTYRITVEDKRRGVDLVPLHRALLSMDGVRDMSLLSYNNGVAIVSLETTGDLDGDELGNFVARAMSRAARVEQHNEHTFVVKLAED